MNKLISGITQFHRDTAHTVQPLLAHLVRHGQKPQAMLITCADSRLMPEELTQADPGDLFVIRNIGNLVPRPEDASHGNENSVGAAIDYALEVLKVPSIVVMGHSNCGAMKALMDGAPADSQVEKWLRHGRLAKSRFDDGQFRIETSCEHDRLSQVNVLASLDNLTHYMAVRSRLETKEVELHGWWFDVANAQMLAYDKSVRRFTRIEDAYNAHLPPSPIGPLIV